MKGIKRYTEEDIQTWVDLKNQGISYANISKTFNIPNGTIRSIISQRRKKGTLPKSSQNPKITVAGPVVPTIVKEKTLDDFSPREIIKHMYNLVYRIDENGLYVIETLKHRVKINDIITND